MGIHRYIRWVLGVFLFALLSACVQAQDPLPDYIVLLTPLVGTSTHCAGVALDKNTILSAEHCSISLRRAISQDGQEVGIMRWQVWPEYDIVLYKTIQPLFLPTYAKLSAINYLRTGTVYGTCKRYLLSIGRPVVYMHPWISNIDGVVRPVDQWITTQDDHVICGGDSGSPIIQDGKVVGIVSATAHKGRTGRLMYAVSPVIIQNAITEQQAQNNGPRPPLPTNLQPLDNYVNP